MVGQFKPGGDLTFSLDLSPLIIVVTSLLKQNPQKNLTWLMDDLALRL